MDIQRVLTEYDNMFGVKELSEIEAFLVAKAAEASKEGDAASLFTLLNEIIGFCRDTGQKEKGLAYCDQLLELMSRMGLEGTIEYATGLLNIANAYRAFGLWEESMKYYEETEQIYLEKLPAGEFNYASLYNNWSLLHQEMEDFAAAKAKLEKALEIVKLYPDAVMQLASTYSNLAATLLRLSMERQSGTGKMQQGEAGPAQQEKSDEYYRQALEYLEKALDIHEKAGGQDMHYSAVLSAMGDALYLRKKYAQAAEYYHKAMKELEKHVGRTEAYDRVADNYANAMKLAEQELEDDAKAKSSLNKVLDSGNDTNTLGLSEQEPESDVDMENLSVKDMRNDADTRWKPERGLELCRTFYEIYGAPMIHEKFPGYEQRIAVGLVGEGSDCFGYDDEISKDHDYGLGFCMWLLPEDYEKIAQPLQKEYEHLIKKYGTQGSADLFLSRRRGVFTIQEFYENLLGLKLSWKQSVHQDAGRNFAQDHSQSHGQDVSGYDGQDDVWGCNRETGQDAGQKSDQNLSLDEQDRNWEWLPEEKLATVTNGEVFRDDAGCFTSVRKTFLSYYSDEIWKRRLAVKLHEFSQFAQSNYSRMMARKDYVTAGICIAEGMKSAMEICYILNKTYAPYYKWMRKGMEQLDRLNGVGSLLDHISGLGLQKDAWENYHFTSSQINDKDEVVHTFEKVAEQIVTEMGRKGLIELAVSQTAVSEADRSLGAADAGNSQNCPDLFLENYCRKLLDEIGFGRLDEESDHEKSLIRDNDRKQTEKNDNISENNGENGAGNKMSKDEYVEKIVALEWKQFDKVKNEGGRADCQDNWNTFSIMRKSQYLAWNEDLLASYLQDLSDGEARGWNLITEKYARMMKSTTPEKYAELESQLPERSDERIAIQEEIIKIQVNWMEEFAAQYPKMAGNARSIHTSEDTPFDTSYETYLRGELGTYSDDTLLLYGRFVVSIQQEGKNLAYIIMNNTAVLYGYGSVEEAENKLE